MIECATKIQSYTAQLGQSAFAFSSITYDATLRNLELIGEAATQCPGADTDSAPGNSLTIYHCGSQPHYSRLPGRR